MVAAPVFTGSPDTDPCRSGWSPAARSAAARRVAGCARGYAPRVPQLPVVDAVVGPIASPVLRMVRTNVLRVCPVPEDFEAVTTIGPEEEVASDADDVSRVWSRVEGLYRSGVHPAIQVCIRHRGRVVLDRSIGYAQGVEPGRRLDPEQAELVTPETPVNLFSAAKAVTGMLMHLLEERGVVDLDAPVAHYLPAFAANGKDRITLRQVLSHRGGVPALPPEAFDLDLLADPERVEALVCELELTAPVGEGPSYHTLTGGFIMECVARRASGESLRELLRREVKQPLGLRWFDLGVEAELTPNVATNTPTGVPLLPPLSWLFDRLIGVAWDDAVRLSNDPRYQAAVIPSANVIATARDTATFYQSLLDQEVLEVGPFDVATVRRAVDAAGHTIALDRRIFLPLHYSAGFMLGTPTMSLYGWNHPRAFGHLGLANSVTWADPDRDLVVALLTTGKAVIGTHMPALLQLLAEIHRAFPVRD